jgi:hypothetical protein
MPYIADNEEETLGDRQDEETCLVAQLVRRV